MKSPTQLYDAAVRYVHKQLAMYVAPVALIAFAKPNADISLDQMFPQTVQLPPDPDSPAYQRKMEADRARGLRNLEFELEAQDRNAAYAKR